MHDCVLPVKGCTWILSHARAYAAIVHMSLCVLGTCMCLISHRVQLSACRSTECGPTECPPGHHATRRHRQLPGEGLGGGADSDHPTTAWILVHVLNSSPHYAGPAGTCGLQAAQSRPLLQYTCIFAHIIRILK